MRIPFKGCLNGLILFGLLTLPASSAPSIDQELNTFQQVIYRVHKYYFEEVMPDTLIQAGIHGLFQALNPAAEYTFTANGDNLSSSLNTFNHILRTVSDSTFYSVSADTLVRFAIAGMMDMLDPYSVFMEKRHLDNFHISTRGKYGGLGFRIQVIYPDSAVAVWQLLHERTPAALAGVKSGDLIVAIDDSSAKGMNASDAADLMRGDPGTPVTLSLLRAGREDTLKIEIFRQEVKINSVKHYTMFPDSIGYIQLELFQQKCSAEVRNAMRDLKRRGMKGLIFDLRGNGGGYLTEAVKIADLFMPANRMVVYTAGRAFQDTTEYKTKAPALLGNLPLIVLVNEQSASASEIVAGAVQDWDRGLILGAPTVGKGSVQQALPINGEQAELKLTMAAYFIPSGRSIDKRMRKDSTLVGNLDKTFKTSMGRTVYGGGGISPDIYQEEKRSNVLFNQLVGRYYIRNFQDNKFFRFARQYPLLHHNLTPDFRADKKTLEQFRGFLDIQKFDYVSSLEARLEQLEKAIEAEEAIDDLEKPLNKLSKQIEPLEEKHWEKHEDLFKWQLTVDILEKAFGVKTAEAYKAEVDEQVLKAREILSKPADYLAWFEKEEIGQPADAIAKATPDPSAE
jgi:carboxyl-terminal processing protease